MKAVGIVGEYNPFHNGHLYHLNRTLEITSADILIVVMSGNFVERGEPALINKWERAKIAIENGADLVIELPLLYTLSNAGGFAKGAINILESLGVNEISFGVTTNKYDKLIDIANYLKENDKRILLEIKENYKGLSYPKARENILVNKFGEEVVEIVSEPNNILAIEYLINMNSSKPLFINRYKVNHNETYNEEIASGTYIRNLINNNLEYSMYIPYQYDFKGNDFEEKLFNHLLLLCIHESEEKLNSYFGAEEGLGSIMKNRYRFWKNYNDILCDLKSKRYTLTRIKRTLLNMILGITKNDVNHATSYARILAFNEKGQEYIKEIKKNGVSCPIITNINKEITEDIKNTIKFDIMGTDLYNQLSNLDKYKYSDFVVMPSRFYKEKGV